MGPSEGEEEEFVTHHCMMITYIHMIYSDIHVQLIIVILVEGAHHRILIWTFISSVKST